LGKENLICRGTRLFFAQSLTCHEVPEAATLIGTMPTLHWIGKEKVTNHHLDIPYHTLDLQYQFGAKQGADNAKPTNQGSDNLIIHADNLLALKSLLPQYEGRIKCIYIDPPYNTGNEGWVYNDNVSSPRFKKWLGQVVGKEGEDLTRHDKWLCMMYPRLKLLHKLLAEDGAIFISIDDNEQASLKMMMDEIFGAGNFINNVIWEKNYSPRNDAKYFSASHDFLVVYAKSKHNFQVKLSVRTEKQNKFYKYDDNDGRGVWRPDNVLVKSFSETGVFGIKNPSTGIIHFPPKGSCYRFSREKAEDLLKLNKFYFGKDGKGKPQMKRYLSEVNEGIVNQTIWKYDEVSHNQDGKKELNKIIEGNVFDSPKPYQLIQKVLQISTNKDSIILDSFAGSGTTAHAVLNLNKQDGGNRKFILIEMEDYAETITAERVKRVINGYGKHTPNPSQEGNNGTGGSFSFYTLGERVLDDEQNLNPSLALHKIHGYIWYSETHTAYTQQATAAGYLGKYNNTGIYFHYQPHQVTVLDDAYLMNVTELCEQYIMYADICLLPETLMHKHNIIFKKIPRDISKL
jgi:adenine-specific DNA-methyltransferase